MSGFSRRQKESYLPQLRCRLRYREQRRIQLCSFPGGEKLRRSAVGDSIQQEEAIWVVQLLQHFLEEAVETLVF